MNNKDKILKMYYEEKIKQNDIATLLEISQSYISQIIKNDIRYNSFKEHKHKQSMQKKAEYNKAYLANYERPKQIDNSYQALQAQLARDAQALSYKNDNYMSNLAFTKWNRSVYKYDKYSSDLVLDKSINVTKDVPKRVSNRITPNAIKVTC